MIRKFSIISVVSVAAFATLLCSCKTVRQMEVKATEIIRTDTIRTNTSHRDSIFILEKEIQREKGDTVMIERWHYAYRDKVKNDTVYKVKTEVETRTEYLEREVEVNRLRWWQKALMWLGACFFVVVGLYVYKSIAHRE